MQESEDQTSSLDNLGKKISKMKSERQEDLPDDAQVQKPGKAMHMATELFAAVAVGGLMGYLLDNWLDTSPIFLLLFFCVGFAAGVRNMLRNYND